MKAVLIFILLMISADPSEIAKVNKLKSQAAEAYVSTNYQSAAQTYSILYDSLGVDESEIALNLAHSYYALQDTSNAKLRYQDVVASSNDRKLKSIAYQQLGVMAKSPATLKESLQYLKAALKADPTNEEARYNYEVVKKLMQEQEQQQQDDQDQNNKDQDQQNENQDQQDQQDQKGENQDQQEQQNQEEQQSEQDQQGEKSEDQQQQDQQNKEGEEESDQKNQQQQPEEGDEEQDQNEQPPMSPDTQQKLEEMNISEDKAQMILEAMKNNEIQYIQQQRRKPTKQADSGKPDW